MMMDLLLLLPHLPVNLLLMHFTKYDGQLKAMCSLCGKGIAYRGRTTNLRNNLLYKHPLIYSPKDKTAKGLGKKRSNLDTVVKARVCSEAKAKEITNCILNLICMDIRPVRMVECEGFKVTAVLLGVRIYYSFYETLYKAAETETCQLH